MADTPPLPTPPFIAIEGIDNFRDLGGYPTSNPTIFVRRNFIFRCAHPGNATEDGQEQLRALGITTLYDLRSEPEIEKNLAITPNIDIKGVERKFTPVFANTDYSPEKVAVRYAQYGLGVAVCHISIEACQFDGTLFKGSNVTGLQESVL
jgi:Tyrosine phosphatase family